MRLLDLEDRLATDAQGTYLASLVESFAHERTTVQEAMAGGLSPAEYDAAARVDRALAAATTVVQKAWRARHAPS
jgi:hypothetical protein